MEKGKTAEEMQELFESREFLYSDEEDADTTAKVSAFEESFTDKRKPSKSTLRVRNAALLEDVDGRYSGTKSSRHQLAHEEKLEDELDLETMEVDNDEESSGSESELLEEDEDEEDVQGQSSLDEEASAGSGSDAPEDDDEDGEGEKAYKESDSDEDDDVDEDENTAHISERDKKLEIEKGRGTQHQLRIWDALLEVRIRLQKILLESNKLPQTEVFESILKPVVPEGEKPADFICAPVMQSCQSSLKQFMDNLIELQDVVLNGHTDTKEIFAVKRTHDANATPKDKNNEEITSSEDEPDEKKKDLVEKINQSRPKNVKKRRRIEDYESDIATRFSSFIKFRNQTIQKWNDKTQVATGKLNKKDFASFHTSTLKQMEQILADKDRLTKRTQLKRSQYEIIGKEAAIQETTDPKKSADDLNYYPEKPADDLNYDPEIFDDDDFYHQLLRELIERKTSNVNDPTQLSRHWLELQKLRSKMKRKVDTKASKGRKVRYEIHSKLVNFMAPYDECPMTDVAVKELFGSLFGNTDKVV